MLNFSFYLLDTRGKICYIIYKRQWRIGSSPLPKLKKGDSPMEMNHSINKNISIDDIFDQAASLTRLPSEELKRRMDEAVSPENLPKTMEALFPELRR
jgi:hypothetical protein